MKKFLLLCLILLACNDNLNYSFRGSQSDNPEGSGDISSPDGGGGSGNPNNPILGDLDNQLTGTYAEAIETNLTDGYYTTDDTLNFIVSFSSDVSVVGTSPKLIFKTVEKGKISGPASYVKQISSDTLEFEYIVKLDDNAEKIDFQSIDFNGGQLLDSNGVSVNSTIQNNLFSSFHTIGLDTVSDLYITLNGNGPNAAPPPFTTITGPGPWLIDGSKYPEFKVSGRDIVGFSYKLVTDPVDCDKDENYISRDSDSVILDMTNESSGSKTFCALGKVSTGFTKPVVGGATKYPWYFDADMAAIIDVNAPAGDMIYKEGDAIGIRLKFTESVFLTNVVNFNPPALSLILDSTPDGSLKAIYKGGEGSDELYFEYTVLDGDNTAFLNVKELILNGAELKDHAGNPAEIFIRGGWLESNNHVEIDTTKPVVVDIQSAYSGYYSAGDKIEIELVFSEAVTVTGSPELVFKVDGVNSALSNATMLPRSGLDNRKLLFSKTFAADENHIDLDILQIDLKGGSIKDLVGHDLDPSFADDLLSKNSSISVINLPKLDFIVTKLDGTPLNELDVFNESDINLQVKSKNPLDPAIGAFKYKVADDEVNCTQDGGSYTEVIGDSVTINLLPTTITPMVICGLSGLSTGFYRPAGDEPDSFKLIRKQTPPPTLIIEGFESSTAVATINASILNPFVGSYKYRFDTVASGIDCAIDTGYKEESGKQLDLTMTSEEEWRLCIYAADNLGNWQRVVDRVELLTKWSTTEAIASVPGGIDKLYNASNAPGSASQAIQVEVNGLDGFYYYKIGPSASTDCSAPFTSGPIAESIPVTSLVYGADGDYSLCLKGEDSSKGQQLGTTKYSWTYDSTAPTITSVTTVSSNGFYSDGDTITFHIEYSEYVILSLNQPKLSLASEGGFDSIGEASYDKALTAKTVQFNYLVMADDNAINISVDSFDLNGAKLTDLAGNDLTLPGPVFPNTSQVSIDNVVGLSVVASDFVSGERTNVQSTDITVSGSDVVGFQYKLTSDPSDCSDDLNYSSQNALQLDLDMSLLKDGPATLCTLGVITSGFSKPAGNGASTLSWIQDLTPPVSPIMISGIPSETNSSSITVTITDTDIAEYRYLVGESSSVDCEDESQYSAETIFGTGDIVLNFATYGTQEFCIYAADDLGNWQSFGAKTMYKIDYNPAPSKVKNISSSNSNGYYDAGEKIEIYVEFDDVVTVSGSDLDLELKSDSIGSLLQNADYESGSGSTTLKFVYTIKDGDNGADIDVEQINLNSSTIIDKYANNADLSIPPNTTLSTQKIGVDTLRPISLSLSPIVPGVVSGLNSIELTISGSNLGAYKYKAAISEADCKSQASYQTAADLNPVSVDVSSFVDGEVHICATGISTSGYEQDSSLAASISYTRDTTCGYVNGDGSSSNPYEIRNEDDLSNMDKADICASSSFILMNDILISSANWSPIGKNTSGGHFEGILDGKGFTISGLSIDKNEDQIGLFSVLKNAVIQDLNIVVTKIKGNQAVGGLAGLAENSSIYNCSVEGDVYSDVKHAGLLLGSSVNSEISHSHTKGSLFGNATIAGFVGHVSGSSIITSSYARVQVFSKNTGSSAAGGFVGILNGSTIESSFSTGNVRSDGNIAGGFVAIISDKSQVTESFSTGNVSGKERIGAFAGSIKENINGNQAAIENSYAIGNIITPVGLSAGFVGQIHESIIRNCYSHSYALYPDSKAGTYESASFVNIVVDDGGASKIEGSYSANYGQKTIMSNTGSNTVEIVNVELGDFNNSANFTELNLSVWAIDPHVGRPVLVNNPESEAYKLIHDADEFNKVRDDLSGYYVLAQDVDLSSYSTGDGWDAIGDETESVDNDKYPGAFKGILDGGPSKHTISGISYDNKNEDYKAMFATTDMASIRNLVIDISEIRLNKYGGVIVGRAMTTSFITNTSSTGTSVRCADDCGGIAGEFRGLLYQVTNSAFVKGDRNVGGIVGDLVGISHIIHGKNSANVEGRDENFAGLVGKVQTYGSLISSSEHTGDIIYEENGSSGKRGKQIGGIIGNIENSDAGSSFLRIYQSNCKDGSIKGNYAVGGLVGRTDSDSLILSMEKSYTTCNIEIADNPKVGGSYSGGLIGWIEKGSVEISESYSNADINVVVEDGQKYENLGGLIGEVHNNVKEFKLENSYYIGDIKADAEIIRCGLLIGRMDTGPDETKIFNTYAMGTLTNCVNDFREVDLFGEAYTRSFPQLSGRGNIQRLYGYNDDLSDYGKHCADGSGKLDTCKKNRGYTSDLNQGVGAGKWMESPNCTVFTGSQALPELISNRQVSGPKCVP